MPDEKTRMFERAAAQGDLEAEERLLRERLRTAGLTKERVTVAAWLGHAAARRITGESAFSLGAGGWTRKLATRLWVEDPSDTETPVRIAIAAAHACGERGEPVRAAERCLLCPCTQCARRAENAGLDAFAEADAESYTVEDARAEIERLRAPPSEDRSDDEDDEDDDPGGRPARVARRLAELEEVRTNLEALAPSDLRERASAFAALAAARAWTLAEEGHDSAQCMIHGVSYATQARGRDVIVAAIAAEVVPWALRAPSDPVRERNAEGSG